MVFVLCCKRHFSRQFCSAIRFSFSVALHIARSSTIDINGISFISFCFVQSKKVFRMNILFSSRNKMSNNDKVSWAKKLFFYFYYFLPSDPTLSFFCECEHCGNFFLIDISISIFRDYYEPFLSSTLMRLKLINFWLIHYWGFCWLGWLFPHWDFVMIWCCKQEFLCKFVFISILKLDIEDHVQKAKVKLMSKMNLLCGWNTLFNTL